MEKKKAKKNETMPKDQVVAILENIRSDFKVFGEGQKDLERKMDKVLNRLDSLENRVDKMDIRLSNLEDKSSDNSIKLIVLEGKIDELKRDVKDSYKSASTYFSSIEKEIVPIKKEIQYLKVNLKEKADLEKLQKIEKRVIKLEKLNFAR
jgi:chromosome segregation protein